MARIRILQGVASPDWSWTPGDVIDLPDEEAARWVDGYRAEYVGVAGDSTGQPSAPPPQVEGQSDEESGASGGGRAEGEFDPAGHTAPDVLAYLASASEREVMRVLEAEAAGKGRTSVLKQREALLAQARAGGDQRDAEKAAVVSRGGGRGGGIETR